MTIAEFSSQFDILYNNISSNQSPGLNEYEKSVFLTNAQYLIVKEYFDPELDAQEAGFDGSPRRQIDLSSLVRSLEVTTQYSSSTGAVLSKINAHSPYPGLNVWQANLSNKTTEQVMLFLNETLTVTNTSNREGVEKTKILLVIPIHYLDLRRTQTKAYGLPLRREAWRIIGITDRLNTLDVINNKSTVKDDNEFRELVYLIPHDEDTIVKYNLTYVKKPLPIILTDLSDTTFSIEGQQTKSGCELDPLIHYDIVERAAQLAKLVYTVQTAALSGQAQKRSNERSGEG